MTILYNKIIGLPVLNLNGKTIGIVKDVIINPENGKFLGFILVPKIFGKKIFVLMNNIKNINATKIIVKNKNKLYSFDDLNKTIKNVLQKAIKIKNNEVKTQSGDTLGKVRDFEIDLTYNILSKIFVSGGILKDLIRGELIISKNQIISISQKMIIVKDIIIRSKKTYKFINKEKRLAEAGLFIKLNGC